MNKIRKQIEYNIADSLEEAIKIAQDRDLMGITSNNGDTEDFVWMCDELDGYPKDIYYDE